MKNKIKLQNVLPADIEKRSFMLITEEMGDVTLDPFEEPVIKRAIHTSADFDYLENLVFSPKAVESAIELVRGGVTIVTDTQMAKAGINKKIVESYGGQVVCFMSDEDVRQAAQRDGTTRAVASMKKATTLSGPMIFAIGNAPTALISLCELVDEARIKPELIIGVPVGFVNVVESKELLLQSTVPHIVARGRKGGSNIAAAICNAILYQC